MIQMYYVKHKNKYRYWQIKNIYHNYCRCSRFNFFHESIIIILLYYLYYQYYNYNYQTTSSRELHELISPVTFYLSRAVTTSSTPRHQHNIMLIISLFNIVLSPRTIFARVAIMGNIIVGRRSLFVHTCVTTEHERARSNAKSDRSTSAVAVRLANIETPARYTVSVGFDCLTRLC